MMDIQDILLQSLAQAEASRIDDEIVRMYPASNPERYAELLAGDEAREQERAEHRATCKCPYCPI